MKKSEHMSFEQKQKISNTLKGHSVSVDTRKKIGKKSKGRHPIREFKKGNIAPKTAFKKGFIPWNKGKRFIEISGKNNVNWKGGITKLNHLIRELPEYKKWISQVFQRDNWICQTCGTRSSVGIFVYLEAHHLKPFIKIIKENQITTVKKAINCKNLWKISNGVTLCHNCHNLTKLGNPKNYEKNI